MSKVRRMPSLVLEIVIGLENHIVEQEMMKDWVDVTDTLRIPSLKSLMLASLMDDYTVDHITINGRTYCYRPDLLEHMGTDNFSVRRRNRYGR